MVQPGEYVRHQIETGGVGPHIVKLLSGDTKLPTQAQFFAALGHGCGRVEPLDAGSDSLSFALLDHRTNFKGRPAVPATHIISAVDGLGDRNDLDVALQQVWDWPLAHDVITTARATLWVTDMMASGVGRKERLATLLHTVRTLARLTSTLAIHWMPSQRIVNPAAFVEADPDLGPVSSAAINVRLFRVEGRTPGEMVMDTLGLSSFGLPDLQCHFAGLDPGAVAGRLYAYATYVFEAGDVIEDGHTVDGVVPGTKWRCQHEEALVGPDREVLDLHPGPARPPA